MWRMALDQQTCRELTNGDGLLQSVMNHRQFGDLLRPWHTRTHCCRHMFSCLPAHVAFVADTNFVSGTETFCVRNKCFPVCPAQETSWATTCPRLPGPFNTDQLYWTMHPLYLWTPVNCCYQEPCLQAPPPPSYRPLPMDLLYTKIHI